MRAAAELRRQDEQRRRNAELRISYGNALSESNLRQMRQHVGGNDRPETGVVSVLRRQQPHFISTPAPRNYGTASNAYSWQLSTSSSPRFQALAPTPQSIPATSTGMWEPPTLNNCDRIARHYQALQKRARQKTRLMEREQATAIKGDRQPHRVQFLDHH